MLIASLNCRGLGKTLKRRHILTQLSRFSVSCLQETYVCDDSASLWSKEFWGEVFFENGTSHSKGLMILINKNFQVENLKEIKLGERCLGISFTHNSNRYYVFNVYAPSIKEDRVPFFKNLHFTLGLNEIPPDSYIFICGDFNSLRNNSLDNLAGLPHSAREVYAFNNFIKTSNLTDCFRKSNPNTRDFSWVSFTSNCDNDLSAEDSYTARRLDYIFCNINVANCLRQSNMVHVSGCDHKLVSANFVLDNFPKGPGRWHFNESLLDDDLFIEYMQNCIRNFLEKIPSVYDHRLTWDVLHSHIKDNCISYSRNKNLNSPLNSLLVDIEQLNNKLIGDPENVVLMRELKSKIVQKEIFELSQAKGALKRSKLQEISENERNTKFFLSIEKSRQNNSTIKSIYDENNTLQDSPSMITKSIASYYKDLLNDSKHVTSQQNNLGNLKKFMRGVKHPVLKPDQKNKMESPLDSNELEMALKQLNFESSPGVDGLTPRFYIIFYDLLKEPLFNCFNEAVQNKSLSLTQRRSIISLLPKDVNSDLNDLGNYRPISITSSAYKIFSRVLANRVHSVISDLIHTDQAAYVSGRKITDHIRLTDELINFTHKNRIPGILVSLDFKKAFDSISRKSILAALELFGFGSTFQGYVETMLNDSEACIKNGGWLSDWFSTTKGVRQGCVLSPLLFILVVECLALKIRSNSRISGILDGIFPTVEGLIRLIQFADDLTLFIKSTKCLTHALEIIDQFTLVTGLTLNRKKSKALPLGGFIPDNNKEGLTWLKPEEIIKIFGIFFSACKEASLIEQNWDLKLTEIERLILDWSRRNISIWGRCLVSKLFFISRINNVIQTLALPEQVLTKIDNKVFHFLWRKSNTANKVTEKIKRATLCLPIEEGGLGMISVVDQQRVMLIKWLNNIRNPTSPTHHILTKNIFEKLGGVDYVLNWDVAPKLVKGIDGLQSVFWKKAILSWLFLDKSEFYKDPNCLPIFNEKSFTYKGNPIFARYWIKNGLKYYYQMMDDQHRIKSLDEIKQLIPPYSGMIIDYLAVRCAISKFQKSHSRDESKKDMDVNSIFRLNNKSIRYLYVRQKHTSPINSILFWNRKFNIDIKPYFKSTIKCTKESKLKLLQFKILHNIFPHNLLLQKMKIKNSNKCDYCREVDLLEHSFVTCIRLKPFWQYIESILEEVIGEEISIDPVSGLVGFLPGSLSCSYSDLRVVNHLIILAKHAINISKYTGNPNIIDIFSSELTLRKNQFPAYIQTI